MSAAAITRNATRLTVNASSATFRCCQLIARTPLAGSSVRKRCAVCGVRPAARSQGRRGGRPDGDRSGPRARHPPRGTAMETAERALGAVVHGTAFGSVGNQLPASGGPGATAVEPIATGRRSLAQVRWKRRGLARAPPCDRGWRRPPARKARRRPPPHGNLVDGPACPQSSWTSPCAKTSWAPGTRSRADRPPRPGCTGGPPRPEPAGGRQQGTEAADPWRVGSAAGRQTRAGPGRSAAVRVRIRTRAPRVATNVIRSAARPVRHYLLTPIGSRHSGPRPQRRGGSRSGRSPGRGRSAPGPARADGWRACPWRTTRSRAHRGGAQAGPGRRPPARGGVTGGGRAVFGAGGRRRAATAAPVVRAGSAPPSPTRRAARAGPAENRRVGAPVGCRTPLRKRRLPGTRTDRPFPRPARLWHALSEPGDDQAGQRAVGRKDSQG